MSTDETGAHTPGRHAAPEDDPEIPAGRTLTEDPPRDPDEDERPGSRRALRRALISLGIVGLILALVVGGGLWFLTDRYAGNIDRVSDVFADLDEDARPAPPTPDVPADDAPVTFL